MLEPDNKKIARRENKTSDRNSEEVRINLSSLPAQISLNPAADVRKKADSHGHLSPSLESLRDNLKELVNSLEPSLETGIRNSSWFARLVETGTERERKRGNQVADLAILIRIQF